MNTRQKIILTLLELTCASQKELLELSCDNLVGIGRELDIYYAKRTVRISNSQAKRDLFRWNMHRIESDGCTSSFLGIKKRQLMKDIKTATKGLGVMFYRKKVEVTGIEPATLCVQGKCSPN